MYQRKNLAPGILSALAMLTIILDGRFAAVSIQEGITLCLQTVIPALFPLLILSGIMNRCLQGQAFRFMTPVRRICKIPEGAESILLIGMISGYPIGAKLVASTYKSGQISKENANRMLGFCSNAGPAFIFGMVATQFRDWYIPWVLWGIHIASALTVGFLLPGGTKEKSTLPEGRSISTPEALQSAVNSMALICGWVIIFRLLLNFLKKWFLWLLPTAVQISIFGLIELTNGCVALQQIENESTRFILCSAILGFGGLCVLMQTASVTKEMGIGYYFPGKLLQMFISAAISFLLCPLLFPGESAVNFSGYPFVVLLIFVFSFVYLLQRKKVVAFQRSMLYNSGNKSI